MGDADRLQVETEDDVEWTLDGERGDAGRRFEIVNLHKRVPLVLPERSMETVPVEEAADEAGNQLSD